MVIESFSLGFTAALIFGVADLMAAVVARRMGLSRLLLWTHVGAVFVATTYLVLNGDLSAVSPTHAALVGGLSVLIIATLVTFYRGLQAGPVALVSPIVSAHLIIVIILSALVLGERLGPVQTLAFGVAAAGIVLATMTVHDRHLGNLGLGKGVSYALLSMLGAGVFIFAVGALAQELGWFLPIYLVRVGSLILLLPAQRVIRSGPWWSPSRKLVLAAAVIGVLQFSGLAAYAYGAQSGSVSLVAAAFSVYPVIPMIGGILLFQERIVFRQAAGLAAVFGGLLMLGMSS